MAQIVGGLFTRGSERRRLEWEHSQRFVELKRELFGKYLAAHLAFWRYLARISSVQRSGETTELVDVYMRHVEETTTLLQEVLLVAPEMSAPCQRLEELRGPAFDVDFHSHDPQWLAKAVAEMEGDPPLVRYKKGISVCADEMSSHLGTA